MFKNEQRLFHLFMALKIKCSREKLKQVLKPLQFHFNNEFLYTDLCMHYLL